MRHGKFLADTDSLQLHIGQVKPDAAAPGTHALLKALAVGQRQEGAAAFGHLLQLATVGEGELAQWPRATQRDTPHVQRALKGHVDPRLGHGRALTLGAVSGLADRDRQQFLALAAQFPCHDALRNNVAGTTNHGLSLQRTQGEIVYSLWTVPRQVRQAVRFGKAA